MNPIYCQICGRANQFVGNMKPNFCAFCSNPLPGSTATASQPQDPNARRLTTRPIGRNRRQEPQVEFHQTEEEAIAEVQDLADRTQISINVTDPKAKIGEHFNLSQVFGNGALGVQNTGGQRDLHDAKKTFTGGDKDTFIRNYFGKNMQKTVIDTAGDK